ncbi:hypothetical protein A0H81_10623 [Grifola frondosa]|uniref:Uncharacterized protein n=1 Tax=Grifola frondosa TaxID=5627 RepID=A0A1C7LYW6_GRIFR|nr:hypothetical protein A0H81_10623 [Grifola frondosa]
MGVIEKGIELQSLKHSLLTDLSRDDVTESDPEVEEKRTKLLAGLEVWRPMHTQYMAPLVDEASMELERTGMGDKLMAVPWRVADGGVDVSDEDDSTSEADDDPRADVETATTSGASTTRVPKRKSTRQGGRSRTKRGQDGTK